MFTHTHNILKKFILVTYLFVACISSTALAPSISFAATIPGTYTLLEPLPCVPGNGVNCKIGEQLKEANFQQYVQYIFNLIIAIASVAAVFMIVWGGFKYTSTDSFSGKSEGKEIIIKAVQGLLMVLISYLLLKTIDPRLVAIPSTLVEPLKYEIEKGTSAGAFFDGLAQQAANYRDVDGAGRRQREENRAKVEAAENELAAIDKQIEDLYDSGVSDDDDAAREQLAAFDLQKQQKRDEILALKIDSQISATTNNLNNIVGFSSENAGELNHEQFIDKLNQARTQWELGTAALKKLGATDSAKLQILNDNYLYTRGQLHIQDAILGTSGSGITSIRSTSQQQRDIIQNKVISESVERIHDPIIKKKLLDAANNALLEINKPTR